MIISIIVGREPEMEGKFQIDTELRKILSVDIRDKEMLEINFPKIKSGYSYDELEALMRFYTKDEMNLEEIVCDIQKNGFFFSLKPSLHISIEEAQ